MGLVSKHTHLEYCVIVNFFHQFVFTCNKLYFGFWQLIYFHFNLSKKPVFIWRTCPWTCQFDLSKSKRHVRNRVKNHQWKEYREKNSAINMNRERQRALSEPRYSHVGRARAQLEVDGPRDVTVAHRDLSFRQRGFGLGQRGG